jgi:hypothetical protein
MLLLGKQFQGIDGFYEAGDFLSHDIKIKSIKDSKVPAVTITVFITILEQNR